MNELLKNSNDANAYRIEELKEQLASSMPIQKHNEIMEELERSLYLKQNAVEELQEKTDAQLADSRRENARLREALQNLLNSHHAVWDSPPPDPKFIRQWADNPVVQRAQSALKLSPTPAEEKSK